MTNPVIASGIYQMLVSSCILFYSITSFASANSSGGTARPISRKVDQQLEDGWLLDREVPPRIIPARTPANLGENLMRWTTPDGIDVPSSGR